MMLFMCNQDYSIYSEISSFICLFCFPLYVHRFMVDRGRRRISNNHFLCMVAWLKNDTFQDVVKEAWQGEGDWLSIIPLLWSGLKSGIKNVLVIFLKRKGRLKDACMA